jgi:AAA ATPase domain
VNPEHFIGREAEGRALLTSVQKGRSVLVSGPSGIGKSVLLEFIHPALETDRLTICVDRVAPFGAFLRDTFTVLWDARALGDQLPADERYKDLETDRKTWTKANPSNDTKARSIIAALEQWGATNTRPAFLIDDVTGITQSVIPWLVELERVCTLIVACTPETTRKTGTKRFWKLLEEVRLNPFSSREAALLLDQLMLEHRVVADHPDVYRQNVLARASGNPGELARLVKYHSSEALVHARDVLTAGQQFIEREERGIAILPIVFALSAFAIAWRYIARARGDLDAYVLSGIAVGVFFVARLLFAKTFKPRSS